MSRPPHLPRPRGALLPLLWLLPLGALIGGCAEPRAEGEPQTSLLRGDRQRSRALRSSDNRPRPEEEEHGPFSADRMDLQPHIARQRAAHREEHDKRLLVMESFAHPACSAVPARARRSCPLLSVGWKVLREVAGGIALVSRDRGLSADQLRRHVLCHVAFGKVHGTPQCPLHAARVRVTTTQLGSEVILTLVTDDPAAVAPLRRQLKQLVP